MQRKDFQKRAKQIKALIQRDDGEIPISEKALDEFFQDISPADFYIAKREYLLKIGTPDGALEDDTLVGLILTVNMDDWVPALFRLLGRLKSRRRWEKKKIFCLDTLKRDLSKLTMKFPNDSKDWVSPVKPPVDNMSAVKIEDLALMKKKIIRLIISAPNSYAVNIIQIIFEDPYTPQPEIAKELGISQGYVSKILKEIQKRLNS